MNSQKYLTSIIRNRYRWALRSFFQKVRIFKFRVLSDRSNCKSRAHVIQPVLTIGKGDFKFGSCRLGNWPSPFYFSGYIHIEARSQSASIFIEDGVHINNNATIIAERCSIHIESNTLIGVEFTVYDSDFHELNPEKRMNGAPSCASVRIGRNVFIGSRVLVLKGVHIGDDSVIAAGTVVTKDVPPRSVVAGNPGKIIRVL